MGAVQENSSDLNELKQGLFNACSSQTDLFSILEVVAVYFY